MVRNHTDEGHVFCAVSQSNTHKIVKVELNADQPGQVSTKDIYVLGAGNIAGLESDPENPNYIYLIDDYQNVLQIYENNDGKGVVRTSVSLALHGVEDELREI